MLYRSGLEGTMWKTTLIILGKLSGIGSRRKENSERPIAFSNFSRKQGHMGENCMAVTVLVNRRRLFMEHSFCFLKWYYDQKKQLFFFFGFQNYVN